MLFQILLLVLALCLTYVYLTSARKLGELEAMGLVVDPGSFPLGSEPIWSALVKGVPFSRAFEKQWDKYGSDGKSRMYGYYMFLGKQVIVLNDMDLIKDVLIKDIEHFLDRRFVYFISFIFIFIIWIYY